MNKTQRLQLKEDFEFACEEYLREFIQKQKYEFSFWVCDEIGTIACFIEQYFFSMNEIKFDIDHNAPKGLIFEWQDACLEMKYDYIPTYENYYKEKYNL